MDLRHFRYFVALAEELHFGKAAARLNISQPPLSQQIIQLEQRLSAKLFERTNRRVVLTEAGKLFLVEARKVLAQAERAQLVATRAAQGEMGEIIVGIFPSAPLIPELARFIFSFRRSYPNVRMTLREMSSGDAINLLTQNKLEIAFVRHPAQLTLPLHFIARQLSWEPLVLLLRRDHPLAQLGPEIPLASLANEPMVYFPAKRRQPLYNQLVALCREAGFEPRIEQDANENGLLISLVAADVGVAILPRSLCRLTLPELCTRSLLGCRAGTYIWFIHPKEPQSPSIRSVLKTMIEISGYAD